MGYKKKVILFLLASFFISLQMNAQVPNYLRDYKKEYQKSPRAANLEWFKHAGCGMFIHYGLYSQLGRGEWVQLRDTVPFDQYIRLKETFTAKDFDAKAIVSLAKKAGMKYITITSKHHDGFAMFKSYIPKYNIVDATPYSKDVIKALSEECQKQGLKMCFYYSQSRDWNEADGLDNDWDYPKERNFQRYLDAKVKPQLTELLLNYGPIGLIWFDTPMTISREQAQSLKDLVRSLQPECIISGRLGGGVETASTNCWI